MNPLKDSTPFVLVDWNRFQILLTELLMVMRSVFYDDRAIHHLEKLNEWFPFWLRKQSKDDLHRTLWDQDDLRNLIHEIVVARIGESTERYASYVDQWTLINAVLVAAECSSKWHPRNVFCSAMWHSGCLKGSRAHHLLIRCYVLPSMIGIVQAKQQKPQRQKQRIMCIERMGKDIRTFWDFEPSHYGGDKTVSRKRVQTGLATDQRLHVIPTCSQDVVENVRRRYALKATNSKPNTLTQLFVSKE